MTLVAGLRGTVDAVVGAADTALALGSGEVEALGTPRVLALVEAATVAAVAGRLDAGSTTVGSRVELDHLAPTPVGAAVRAEAVLAEVTGAGWASRSRSPRTVGWSPAARSSGRSWTGPGSPRRSLNPCAWPDEAAVPEHDGRPCRSKIARC